MGCQKLAMRDHFDLSRHFWPQMTTNQFAIPFNLNKTVLIQQQISDWLNLNLSLWLVRIYLNIYNTMINLFIDTSLFGISFFEYNSLEWFLKWFMIWNLWIRFLIGRWVVGPSFICVICISWWRRSIWWQARNTAG